MKIKRKESINGLFSVPGDKSISHRAVILSALMDKKTTIDGFATGKDCMSTIECINKLGVKTEYEAENNRLIVYGNGIEALKKPESPLDCGNSGTTMRLLSGILAACPFVSVLTGDESLLKRPMKRIIEPLEQMGVKIQSQNGFAPLTIYGNPDLKGITYDTGGSSAQVKSCILLAGLNAEGETVVTESFKSRDHTEILLKHLGASISTKQNTTTIRGNKRIATLPLRVPGDISSAAYLMAAAVLLKQSKAIITHVGVNITRTGIISVLREMGAFIDVINRRKLCGEFVADIVALSSELTGTVIEGSIIPRLIDELPLLAVMALFAEGKTIIKDAAELRVKESDRIEALVTEIKKLGGKIEATEDGMIIEGGNKLVGAKVNSHNDHRLAMALSIAALCAEGETEIEGAECASISYPEFYDAINIG